jgi:sporulation protein YlmC with PRC-barrel domain
MPMWATLGIILLLAVVITLVYQTGPQAAARRVEQGGLASNISPLVAPMTQPPDSAANLSATLTMNGTPAVKPAELLTGTTIIGREITTPAGQRIGEVENVAVNPTTGDIPYALLTFGRPLERTGKVYGVTTVLLELNRQHEAYVLHAEQQKIIDGPGIDQQTLANGADLPGDFHPFMGSDGTATQDAANVTVLAPTAAPNSGSLVLLRQLIGWQVWNRQGQQLGSVQDFVFDEAGKRVQYAVVALGGALQPGEKLTLVPLKTLRLDTRKHTFTLDINQPTLAAAPNFTQDTWPDTSRLDWDATARDFWQKRGVNP